MVNCAINKYMPKMNKITGFDFVRIINSLDKLSTLVLRSPKLSVFDDKTRLIAEFLQKSNSLLNAQSLLMQDYHIAECAILYRTHLERYIYLLDIVKNHEYTGFIKWSDSKQIKLLEKMITAQRIDGISIPPIKLENLKKKIDEKQKWDSFRIENFFDKFNLRDAYTQQYEMASSFVHTRVNQDNNTILKIKETSDFYKIDHWAIIECAIQLHIEILSIALSECYKEVYEINEFFFKQVERYVAGEINFNSFNLKFEGIYNTLESFQ